MSEDALNMLGGIVACIFLAALASLSGCASSGTLRFKKCSKVDAVSSGVFCAVCETTLAVCVTDLRTWDNLDNQSPHYPAYTESEIK